MLSRMQPELPVYTVGVLQKDDAFRTMAPDVGGPPANIGELPEAELRRGRRRGGPPALQVRDRRPLPALLGRGGLGARDQGMTPELLAYGGAQGARSRGRGSPAPRQARHRRRVDPLADGRRASRRPASAHVDLERRRPARRRRRGRGAGSGSAAGGGRGRGPGARAQPHPRRAALHLGPAPSIATTVPRKPISGSTTAVPDGDGPRVAARDAAPASSSRARAAAAMPRPGGGRARGPARPPAPAAGPGRPPRAARRRSRRAGRRARATAPASSAWARSRAAARSASAASREPRDAPLELGLAGSARRLASSASARSAAAAARSSSAAARAAAPPEQRLERPPLGRAGRARGLDHRGVEAQALGDASAWEAPGSPTSACRAAQRAGVDAHRRVGRARRGAGPAPSRSGWWVVATTSAPRSTSRATTAWASREPSSGSVPAAGSSSSTSDRGPVAARIATRRRTWAEKVDRLSAIDWSSPMSASTRSNTGRRARAAGTRRPHWWSIASRPSVFSATVLPPVFGPRPPAPGRPRAAGRSARPPPGRAADGGPRAGRPRRPARRGIRATPARGPPGRARGRGAASAAVSRRPRATRSSPTSRESTRRMRASSSGSAAASSRTLLFASTSSMGSMKSVCPEPELSWTMPGTAERDDAFTASTGRPPRSVVNDSCRWERSRAARVRSRSAAARRAPPGGGAPTPARARRCPAGRPAGRGRARGRPRRGGPRRRRARRGPRPAAAPPRRGRRPRPAPEPDADRGEHLGEGLGLEGRVARRGGGRRAQVGGAAGPADAQVAQAQRLLGLGRAAGDLARVGRWRQRAGELAAARERGQARQPLAHGGQLEQLGASRVHGGRLAPRRALVRARCRAAA